MAWPWLSSWPGRMTRDIWLRRPFPLEYLIQDVKEAHGELISCPRLFMYTNLWTETITAPSIWMRVLKMELVTGTEKREAEDSDLLCSLSLLCAQPVLSTSWDCFPKSVFQIWERPTSQGSWNSQRPWDCPRIPQLVSDRAEFPSRFVLKWPSDSDCHSFKQKRMTAVNMRPWPCQELTVSYAVIQALWRKGSKTQRALTGFYTLPAPSSRTNEGTDGLGPSTKVIQLMI